jgi:lipopolysaccharide biosynthesis protein
LQRYAAGEGVTAEATRAARAPAISGRTPRPRPDVVMRVLAFYLPQFHPIPENDQWWGKGFTEWTNVTRAKPLIPGHYQPHLAADLGYYDLRVPEVREAQAAMARAHEVSGFCYYHYWFNGRRLLHRPFDEVLQSGTPEFPFCLCWANENWTRRWDGGDHVVLMSQVYSLEDDERHIEHLLPAFSDKRYIKIDGKPLFLVYRTGLLPDPARTAAMWRDRARSAGFPDLYLARVEGWGDHADPAKIGFDAAVEFAPDFSVLPTPMGRRERWDTIARVQKRLRASGLMSNVHAENAVYRYADLKQAMMDKPPAEHKRFRCVTPGWDNSARRAQGATILLDSTPDAYEAWLEAMVRETLQRRDGEEQVLFINAWNEWAEGNHLEPDQRWGRAYLEATARVLRAARTSRP